MVDLERRFRYNRIIKIEMSGLKEGKDIEKRQKPKLSKMTLLVEFEGSWYKSPFFRKED